ncbi:MAG: hypothetical protein QOI63_1941 [Thermoplasmata archaeon]|nr:hypothetical protein [Thermoplasmata archaeon]
MHPGTVPALALAALLALGGLAAAEGSDGGGTSGPSGDPNGGNATAPPDQTAPSPQAPPNCDQQPPGAARDRCLKERYCRNNPSDARCANRPRADGTAPPKSGEGKPAPGRVDRLQHIQFTVAAPRHITGYAVEGQLTLESLWLDTGGDGPLHTERSGETLMVGDAGTRLRLHDNPVGLIELKGDGGARLTFPLGVTITPGPAGHAAQVHYADGRDGLLVADDAQWDGRNVTLAGFFTFHVARGDGPFEQAIAKGELRSKIEAALETRRLGAEVSLEKNPANASRAVQVLAYDDLSVNVTLPVHGSPIAVRLAANLTQGRTVVLHVDPALVANATADRLALRYFDDHSDGTQTEVVFAMADSLADVLDPTNDGGRPEYWVVSDADGLQVLVSVPHWSTHTVTLAGIGAILQPSVLMGLVAGVAGTMVAAVAMFWPRRQP